MGVRQVSHRGGNMIGRFPSLKLERMVAFESLLEQDYLYVLDYERDVLLYEEQPFTVEYLWRDKIRRYTPDFHVTRAERHELVECKPAARVDAEENQRKFAAARQWCRESGWRFVVVTDEALRNGHRLANIKLLTRYARLAVTPQITHQITQHLQNAPSPITLLEMARFWFPQHPQQGMAALLHLAFHHQIALSLTVGPISGSTPIMPGGSG